MNLLNSFHAVLVAAGVVGLLHPWDSFDVFECKDRNWLIQQWTDWMMTWTCRVQEIFPMLHCKLFCKLRRKKICVKRFLFDDFFFQRLTWICSERNECNHNCHPTKDFAQFVLFDAFAHECSGQCVFTEWHDPQTLNGTKTFLLFEKLKGDDLTWQR